MVGMDLFDYLSEWKHYASLIKEGQYEARRLGVYNSEDIDDMTSGAMEDLLDYFQRKPEKVAEVEAKEMAEMNNYLKKAMRNRICNIVKKRNRQKAAFFQLMAAALEDERERVHVEQMADGRHHSYAEIFNKIKEKFGLTLNDVHQFNLKETRQDVNFFIEEKFGREKWPDKKEAVNIFLERVEQNLSLTELESRYPQKNIASLNTEAHRLIKRYIKWLKTGHKSAVFRNENRRYNEPAGGRVNG
jgi:hypothetical protein